MKIFNIEFTDRALVDAQALSLMPIVSGLLAVYQQNERK